MPYVPSKYYPKEVHSGDDHSLVLVEIKYITKSWYKMSTREDYTRFKNDSGRVYDPTRGP